MGMREPLPWWNIPHIRPTSSVLITPTDKSHSEIIIGQNIIHHKEANVEFTPPVQINNP